MTDTKQGVHVVVIDGARPIMTKEHAIATLRWMIEMLESDTEAEVLTLEFLTDKNVVRPWTYEQFAAVFAITEGES